MVVKSRMMIVTRVGMVKFSMVLKRCVVLFKEICTFNISQLSNARGNLLADCALSYDWRLFCFVG